MEKITLNIKNVKLFLNDDSSDVQLTFDKAVKGYVKEDDGSFVEADTTQISIPRSKLTAQLCTINDDIALFKSTINRAFNQKELSIILFNATINIVRTKHVAGEVIGEGDTAVTIERDCYFTDIVSVKLSSKATEQLDKATSL